MEGKELWKLLDLVKSLREEQNIFEKQANEAIGSEKPPIALKANAYKEITDRLETLLKKLNS
jgi:hypothetical protein